MPDTSKPVETDPVKEKLIELLSQVQDGGAIVIPAGQGDRIELVRNQKVADHLIANGVTVQQWIPVSEPPKEPGEYTVAQKHWLDGHLETKKGKWNGVEWFVDGRESLLVAFWMPPLPLPEPPKGE